MSAEAPQTVPAPIASRPRKPLPPGACDAHSHVFGPFDRFPPLTRSVYALPEAGPDVHARVRQTLGLARGVLTQPAPYGMDPGAMLAAIAQAPDALRAIAVADDTVGDATLERWRATGITGLRFIEMRTPSGERYPGSVGFADLHALAPRMRALGFHAQLWAKAADLAEHLPALLRHGVPVVLDHMGCPDPSEGADGPAFSRIVDLLGGEELWIKLTLCRVATDGPDYGSVRRLHDALVERAPERLVWGSDWPYVRLQPPPDAGHMADILQDWVGDEDLLRRILVTNPERLYGFSRERSA
jgi:predicted TIM-barrel fold metal-dependent hydrolase